MLKYKIFVIGFVPALIFILWCVQLYRILSGEE